MTCTTPGPLGLSSRFWVQFINREFSLPDFLNPEPADFLYGMESYTFLANSSPSAGFG